MCPACLLRRIHHNEPEIPACLLFGVPFGMPVSCGDLQQALTVNALSGNDREQWMRAINDKVQQLKDALVVLPKRKGTR